MAKDFLNAEIEVGDVAAYVTTGRYPVRAIVEVVEVKTKVKVKVLKSDRSYGVNLDSAFWAYPDSLFIVESFKGEL